MQKLLIICGPTAVGKTNLAYEITKQIPGEILSADSRQIFRALPVMTGKDIPEDAALVQSTLTELGKKIPYWNTGFTRIWGTDLLDLSEGAHSSLFTMVGNTVLSDIASRKILPIVVGGTGMYIEALLGKYDTVHVPRSEELRTLLDSMSVEQLQERLMDIDLPRIGHMNESDRKNKRRLERAIEIAVWRQTNDTPLVSSKRFDTFWIGLTAPRPELEQRIKTRLDKRWPLAVDEVKQLSNTLVGEHSQTILGLSEVQQFLDGKLTEDEAKELWYRGERQYSKRQQVWFLKNPDILWTDVSEVGWKESVLEKVRTWYTDKDR